MTVDIDHQIRMGAEDLQWEIFKNLFSNLNEAIASEEEYAQEAIDDQFAALTGRSAHRVKVPRIKPENFHMGNRPSIIEAPPSELPAVAVTCRNLSPSAAYDHDRSYTSAMRLTIECITHSGPYEVDGEGNAITRGVDPESDVERRCKRVSEAIHRIISLSSNVGFDFRHDGQSPSVLWGDIFIRDAIGTKDAGRYYWQGVQLQYNYLSSTVFDKLDNN